MIPVRDFGNYVARYVNGAPVPAVEDAVLDAAIEWCRRTRCDTRTSRAIDVDAGWPEVEVPKPEPYLQVASVLTVWSASGGEIPSRTRRELEEEFPAGWMLPQVGKMSDVYGWISTRPAFVRFVPYLTVALPRDVTCEFAAAPTRNAIEVPDFLYEQWAEEIGWGACARLHAMPEAAWADGKRSVEYRAMFERAVSLMGDTAVSGFNKARLRVRPAEMP